MGEFHPDPPPRIPDFWNSRIREYSRTAGMSSRGSFIPLGETVCTQGAESISRRVTRLRDPRGYRFPKIWTIFKLGVSFLSKNNPDFFQFQNSELF